MAALFDQVLKHVEPPKVGAGGFRMLGTLLESNPYLGRIVTGRVFSGSIRTNTPVKVLDREGDLVETGRVSKILAFRGIERAPIDEAVAGDIIAIAGLEKFNVADTLMNPEEVEPLHAQPIDPPTLSMTFSVNDSPLAGTEGDKVTSRVIRDRLFKEAEGNVALKVEAAPNSDAYVVSGRGELQLAILIETMRREGFELGVSRPKVLYRKDESGEILEPIEEVVIDVDEEHSGVVVQKMSERKGEMIEMRPSGGGRLRLVFLAPTRGLIGYLGELLDRHARHRDHEPPVPQLGPMEGRHRRAAQRGADLERGGRSGRLCDVEPRGSRPDDDRAGLEGLSGHDRRPAQPRQ